VLLCTSTSVLAIACTIIIYCYYVVRCGLHDVVLLCNDIITIAYYGLRTDS
jgi:hypothetical protein